MTFHRNPATGVEFSHDGALHRVGAGCEVVLSLGAIQTPKVLMQSRIGNQAHLHQFGIPVVQHPPGVGQNLQDHPRFDCVWEYRQPLAPRNTGIEATYFWRSTTDLDTPREVMPGTLKGTELERFVRDAASPYWHQTSTAKMGQGTSSVVDGKLNVYGTEHLRIADGSILPRVTTGSTVAPCVIVGECAAQILRDQQPL